MSTPSHASFESNTPFCVSPPEKKSSGAGSGEEQELVLPVLKPTTLATLLGLFGAEKINDLVTVEDNGGNVTGGVNVDVDVTTAGIIQAQTDMEARLETRLETRLEAMETRHSREMIAMNREMTAMKARTEDRHSLVMAKVAELRLYIDCRFETLSTEIAGNFEGPSDPLTNEFSKKLVLRDDVQSSVRDANADVQNEVRTFGTATENLHE
jgi:hypothetical protein